MKLFSIYYINVMGNPETEIVASDEMPTEEQAVAYLIKHEIVGEMYDEGVEIFRPSITTLDGDDITEKVEVNL